MTQPYQENTNRLVHRRRRKQPKEPESKAKEFFPDMDAKEDRLRRFIGIDEVRSLLFVKSVLSEFIATAILIIAGCGGVVSIREGKSVTAMEGAVMFGMTVAMIVWTFNHASGAHINPVVSWCFVMVGQVSLIKFFVFVVVQCAGAIAGAAVVWYSVPPAWRGNLGSTVFVEGLTDAQGFGIEVISTFILMLGVLASGDRLRTDHNGSMPLTIGLIVLMQSLWAGKLTGCSMNPARTLGPALISGTWDHHWVYWTAPFIGGSCGTLLYRYVFAESTNIQPPDISVGEQLKHSTSTILSSPSEKDFDSLTNVNKKGENSGLPQDGGAFVNQDLTDDEGNQRVN